MESSDQRQIHIYIGGANAVYYEKAFPHFVDLLLKAIKRDPKQLENTLLILQQHPRAKSEGSRDALILDEKLSNQELPQRFEWITSPFSTVESLSIADRVYYFQTSMAAQFVLAGIPQIAQIRHHPYSDILLRSGYPCIVSLDQFLHPLHDEFTDRRSELENALGVDPQWQENFLRAIEG